MTSSSTIINVEKHFMCYCSFCCTKLLSQNAFGVKRTFYLIQFHHYMAKEPKSHLTAPVLWECRKYLSHHLQIKIQSRLPALHNHSGGQCHALWRISECHPRCACLRFCYILVLWLTAWVLRVRLHRYKSLSCLSNIRHVIQNLCIH